MRVATASLRDPKLPSMLSLGSNGSPRRQGSSTTPPLHPTSSLGAGAGAGAGGGLQLSPALQSNGSDAQSADTATSGTGNTSLLRSQVCEVCVCVRERESSSSAGPAAVVVQPPGQSRPPLRKQRVPVGGKVMRATATIACVRACRWRRSSW